MAKIQAKIISIENTFDNYYSIKLEQMEDFTWKAGQFVIVRMPKSEINGKDKRTLSIASAPSEGYIMLGTRTRDNISDFKKELLAKKAGDMVELEGPMGKFVKRDEVCPIVLIAGGIGITPIRAMIKSLEDDVNFPIELIYSARGYHMYLDELKEIAKKNNKLKIHITDNRVETDEELDKLIKKYDNTCYYYISGTTEMVKGIKEKLEDSNIDKTKVIADMMIGY